MRRVRGRFQPAGGADCAVGSGEWAEPPHSPWTLRRRGRKKAHFWAVFEAPYEALEGPLWGYRGSCLVVVDCGRYDPNHHHQKPIHQTIELMAKPWSMDEQVAGHCALR